MNLLFEKYINYITTKPKVAVTVIGLITLVFAGFATQLKIDATPYVLERDHSSRKNESDIRQHFANTGEQAMVAIATQKESIFNVQSVEIILNLTDEFYNMSLLESDDIEDLKSVSNDVKYLSMVEAIEEDGINRKDERLFNELNEFVRNGNYSPEKIEQVRYISAKAIPVRDVRSFSSIIENITSTDDELDIHSLIDTKSTGPVDLVKLEEEVRNNPIFQKLLVSKDLKSASVLVEFNIPEYDSKTMLLAYEEILAVTDRVVVEGESWISGPPVITAQIAATIQADNNKFFPFVVLVISLVLYLSFRRKLGVVIPLAIAVITTIWTIGLMSAFGIAQNIITTVLPVFLISIGVADAIHFMSTYYGYAETHESTESSKKTLSHLFLPLLLTSITTVCGFLALSYTELSFLQEFGIFIAVGVFFAFVITVTLLPSLMPLLPADSMALPKISKKIPDIAIGINKKLMAKPVVSFFGFVLVGLTAVMIGKEVQIDNVNIESFSEDTRLRQDDNKLNQNYGGTIPTNIWFHSEEPGQLLEPDVIFAIEKIQNYLATRYEIEYSIAYTDYLKRLHQAIMQEQYEIPNDLTRPQVAQYLLMYENSKAQQIREVLDSSYQNARLMMFAKSDQATLWTDITDNTLAYAESVLPNYVKVEFSGFGYIQKANLTEIIHGQLNSIIIATVLISIIMVVIFKSLSIGIISIIPLVLTLALNFTIMTELGFYLDIGTSLVAGIVFGIGIDYPIHFMAILRRESENTNNLEKAITETLRKVSTPIVINSISLSLGFLVLCLSGHATLVKLGLLVSGTMLLCGIVALFTLPTLVRLVKPKLFSNRIETSPDVIASPNPTS